MRLFLAFHSITSANINMRPLPYWVIGAITSLVKEIQNQGPPFVIGTKFSNEEPCVTLVLEQNLPWQMCYLRLV